MLEFARGIQRIDVYHGQAGTQYAEGRDWILQAVGHHQGDAVALLQLQFAKQVGSELLDQLIRFAVSDGFAEAVIRRPVGKAFYRGGEHLGHRAELLKIDFGGNAGRITLQTKVVPDSSAPLQGVFDAPQCVPRRYNRWQHTVMDGKGEA